MFCFFLRLLRYSRPKGFVSALTFIRIYLRSSVEKKILAFLSKKHLKILLQPDKPVFIIKIVIADFFVA